MRPFVRREGSLYVESGGTYMPRLRWSVQRAEAVSGMPEPSRYGAGHSAYPRRSRRQAHPPVYLRASEEQRRALLAGLLDTDGYVSRIGQIQFAVTNRRLAEDAFELVLSLGYRATMKTRPVKGRSVDSSTCYMINFTAAEKVFRLSRKAVRQVTSAYPTTLVRYIIDVRAVPSTPVRCVEVDNADHMYLASKAAFLPTTPRLGWILLDLPLLSTV